MSVGVLFSCWMPATAKRLTRSSSCERERRIQDHVGVHRERRVELLLERRQAHDGVVEVRAGREICAEARERVADLERVHRRGAFVEHLHRDARDAGRRELIGREARVELQAELHDGHRMTLGDD